ncbi:MAG: 3-deoxy-7-phosphoheptulonate synthase [Oscillospiraceae bacterium]
MTITLKAGASQAQIQRLNRWLQDQGGNPRICVHEGRTVLELTETMGRVDPNLLADLEFVQSVGQATERRNRYRQRHPSPRMVITEQIGRSIGGHFCLIADPCSWKHTRADAPHRPGGSNAGAHVLRGGAFKPRTSPYDFQGLGAAGMEILMEAKQATGLPIVTEITNVRQIPLFADVDIIQIGARNMQNFDLLKEVGKLQKPILLKRGFCATIREWLLSAEYILSEGNERVILCERGIRTFETDTRNTLDLSAVPILKHFSPLPVIVDPSHATGRAELVEPMALAATAAGAGGVMVEVHTTPPALLCDGAQSLTPEQFARVAKRIQNVRKALELPAQEDDEPDCRRPYFR